MLVLVACSFPLVILCAWVLKAMTHRSGMIPYSATGEAPIHLSALGSEGRLLVNLESSGCRNFSIHQLVFNGATGEVTVVLKECGNPGLSGQTIGPAGELLGSLSLSRKELEGLDRYLDLIREHGGGTSMGMDNIRMSLFKGTKLAASEQFSDLSGIGHYFTEDEKGNLVFSAQYLPDDARNSNVLTFAMLFRRLLWQAKLEEKSAESAKSSG